MDGLQIMKPSTKRKLFPLSILFFFASALAAPSLLFAQPINPYARTIRNATADPTTCQVSVNNVFFNRTTGLLKLCTAVNTWSSLLKSTGGTVTGPLQVPAGVVGAPGLALGEATTGLYLSVSGVGVLDALGVGVLSWSSFPSIHVLAGASLVLDPSVLTAGTITAVGGKQANVTSVVSRFDWTNAQVVGLGAVLSGNLVVATLPAKTVIKNAYVVITGAATGTTTLTVSVGRTAATFTDYIVAKDAKAAANTVYGAVAADRGTNLTGFDLPAWAATTPVNIQFIATGTNLNTVLTSTGSVYLETMILP